MTRHKHPGSSGAGTLEEVLEGLYAARKRWATPVVLVLYRGYDPPVFEAVPKVLLAEVTKGHPYKIVEEFSATDLAADPAGFAYEDAEDFVVSWVRLLEGTYGERHFWG